MTAREKILLREVYKGCRDLKLIILVIVPTVSFSSRNSLRILSSQSSSKAFYRILLFIESTNI